MDQFLCILGLLCFASCVAENESLQGFRDLQLQQDSFPWLKKMQDKQELTKKQNFIEWLYSLSKSKNGFIHQEEEEEEKRGEAHRDLEVEKKSRRGLWRGITSKARDASCRIFFWKTWASC